MAYYCCCRPDWVDASVDFCACDDREEFDRAVEVGENPCFECTWWRDYHFYGERI